MNRLHTELHRLYQSDPDSPGDVPCLIDPQGRVRALVLEVARPADWGALSAVWQGVQADLALPAPAIAVSGVDGYQLWFSLAEAMPATEAWGFLEGLRLRYLGQIATGRVRLWPSLDPSSRQASEHARSVPAEQQDTGHWSAFVAPDLAAVFNDDPWLDLCPSPDAQADVLARLACIKTADFEAALVHLKPAAAPVSVETVNRVERATPGPQLATARSETSQGPRQFLLRLMNDPSVELQWRLEAAKALLPHMDG